MRCHQLPLLLVALGLLCPTVSGTARLMLRQEPAAGAGQAARSEVPETPGPSRQAAGDAAGDEAGFIPLFDGSSLDQFRGYGQEERGAGWRIEGDTLHFDGTGGGDLCTVREFGDFELRFDWRVGPGANSGVMYRVSLGDAAPYLSGPEYQILDDQRHPDGQRAETGAASLYALYAPQDKTLREVGEWNEARIVLRGNHVEHWLNGVCVVNAEMHGEEWNRRVAASKFARWSKFGQNPRGHLCFQDHGDPVWFRNIRIRPFDDPAVRDQQTDHGEAHDHSPDTGGDGGNGGTRGADGSGGGNSGNGRDAASSNGPRC